MGLARLTYALDASGSKSEPMIVVAGFLSSVAGWNDFSEAWNRRLALAGIDCFHGKELYSYFSDEKDEGIKRGKRNALLDDLMEIIRGAAFCKVGCVVEFDILNRLSEEQRELMRLKGYSYAGFSCYGQAQAYFRGKHWRPVGLEYIFEDGDEGKGDLIGGLRYVGVEPEFRPKKDTVRRDGTIRAGFTPLQAADWLAHTLFAYYRGYIESGRQELKKTWAYEQFEYIEGTVEMATINHIEQLNTLLKVFEETGCLGEIREALRQDRVIEIGQGKR